MSAHTRELTVDTVHRRIVDLTSDARQFVRGIDVDTGLLNVFVPHATAGIAILELGSGSDEDLLAAIDRLLPRRTELYRHRHGTPGHGADHVLPAFVSPSVVVPVVTGDLGLGIWQSIALVDTNVDNPQRRVRLTLLTGATERS